MPNGFNKTQTKTETLKS